MVVSACPMALDWMSCISNSTESSTPAACCMCVTQAGIMPEDSAVDPDGIGSRSSTKASIPESAQVKAATKPHAPPPMMITGTDTSNLVLLSALTITACSYCLPTDLFDDCTRFGKG